MKAWLVIAIFGLALGANAKEGEGEVESFWQRTKQGIKRGAKGVGKGGKEVGRGFQEIFDPNDEDLQAERKGRGKKKKDDDE